MRTIVVTKRTTPTWRDYREAIGDRSSLFAQIAATWPVRTALYPGSYVDLSPATAIESVIFVDTDARAAAYFRDEGLIKADLGEAARSGAESRIGFHQQDYSTPLPVAEASVDLLISLYAGFVWDACGRYLAPHGLLLANASHGDASIAALDPTLRLVAAVHQRAGRYRLDTADLDSYLIPKRPSQADPDAIRRAGCGIAYTRPAFAYLFQFAPMIESP